jgi:hypothetical protein
MKSFRAFLIENENSNLRIVRTRLNSKEVQRELNDHEKQLPLFNQIKNKGMDKEDRECRLYYDGETFVGYAILVEDMFAFDNTRNLKTDENAKSDLKTLNISDVEVPDNIRKDTSKPKYGQLILNGIFEESKKKYDGITLQANNDKLLEVYEKKYGFKPFDDKENTGNGMVKWLDEK